MAGKDDDSKIEKGGREIKNLDEKCRVRIYISATDAKTKKNISKNVTATLYVKESKVTDVEKQITKAFGG